MKSVITGGTGFLGRAIARGLVERGHTVVVLSRHPARAGTMHPSVSVDQWDGRSPGEWRKHLDNADLIINMAGESIGAGRWTATRKERILSSRVNATRAIVAAIGQASKKPQLLINVSAVGYYGNVPQGEVEETHPPGRDFLASVCQEWEKEGLRAAEHGVRVVLPRFGVVLGKGGGALPRLVLPFKLFAGGWLGSGVQWFPWVHREDIVRAMVFFFEQTSVSGPVNVVAPHAVTMKEFCRTLGKAMHRPCWAPVPALVLRIALGEMADMLLTGQRVSPKKLTDAGYRFRYPTPEEALRDILKD